MRFEGEAFPLAAGGVPAVSAPEGVLGWVLLKGRKGARRKLQAHVLLTLAGLWFLFCCVFAARMGGAARH